MFHRRKQHFMGCALATAAMLADATYADAEQAALGEDPAKLRSAPRMYRLLAALTGCRWRPVWLWRFRTAQDFPFPDWPVAAFLQDSGWRPRLGQWVAVKPPMIHDPGLPVAVDIRRYRLKHWYVAHLFEPWDRGQFSSRLRPARVRAVLEQLARDMAEENGRKEAHDNAARK